MKRFKSAIIALVMAAMLSPSLFIGEAAIAASRASTPSSRAEYDQFLKQTGFPDLAGEIAKTLASPEASNLEKINRETLIANQANLQIINIARDLATELLAELAPRLSHPDESKKIAELVARLLSQKRLAIPDAYPDAIRNMTNPDQRHHARYEFLVESVNKNVLRMREQTLSDILSTLYGQSYVDEKLRSSDRAVRNALLLRIRSLDKAVDRYVRALYFDYEMGRGRWLGEALALALVHTARLSSNPTAKSFENLLSERTRAHGEILSDYVSDTLTFTDIDGKTQKVKIKSGDTVSHNTAWGRYNRMTTSGIRPSNPRELERAERKKLLTPLWITAEAADEGRLQNKAFGGEELSADEQRELDLANDPRAKRGASHGGMAAVYRNPQSGVAASRILDQMPEGTTPWGATRFVSTRAIYLADGPYSGFSVASLRAKETVSYLQTQIRNEGYKRVYHVSGVMRQNEEGKLRFVEGEQHEWQVRITEAEQQKILSIKPEAAQDWLDRDLTPRLINEMMRNLTTYGLAFRGYGTQLSYKGACFCTETIRMLGIRETGFPLQSSRDTGVWPFKGRSRLPDEMPISPNFMAWDPKTNTRVIQLRLRTPVASIADQMQTPREDLDPKLTQTINRFIDRRPIPLERIGQAINNNEELTNRIDVTKIPDGKNAGEFTFAPRAVPLPATVKDAPQLPYNSELTRPYLIAKILALKPINPPRDVPSELRAITNEAQREAAIKAHLQTLTARQIEQHTRMIVGDFAALEFGSEKTVSATKIRSAEYDAIRARINSLYQEVGAELVKIYTARTRDFAFGTRLAQSWLSEGSSSDKAAKLETLDKNLKTFGLVVSDFFAPDGSLRSSPKDIIERRWIRSQAGRRATATETVQRGYSPYVEVSANITRALDAYFGSQPKFQTVNFTAQQKNQIVSRLEIYMTTVNREQHDSRWQLGLSHPSSGAMTCSSIF